MNRRSFLKSILAAGVASAFLPGAGRVWKRNTETGIWIVNPEWESAPYEEAYLFSPALNIKAPFLPALHKAAPVNGFTLLIQDKGKPPRRFTFSNNGLVEVQPFIQET